MPNVYPYLVDDVGEGIQCKRRGQAVMIDHMTPPLDKAGLDPELQQLAGLISDYGVAKGQSLPLADAKREEMFRRALKKGLLKDLSLEKIRTDEDVETLEDYLKSVMEKVVPFGLHTFGVAPGQQSRRATAEAVVAAQSPMAPEERRRQLADLDRRMVQSGSASLAALLAALAGKYIPAATGNDPIRSPHSLPTGKNFYALDPNRIPSRESYAMGAKLAGELLADYQRKHHAAADKLAFTLWAVETIRHEGIVESQILNLLGARPRWDAGGRVTGVELIPRSAFAHLRRRRGDPVRAVPRRVPQPDDLYRRSGEPGPRSGRAGQRRPRPHPGGRQGSAGEGHSAGPGTAYGLGPPVHAAVGRVRRGDGSGPRSQSWEHESQVAADYFRFNGFLYGQGFWGDSPREQATGDADLGQDLFRRALSGTKVAVHSMSSNVIGTIDNDDFYEYLGGTALAVRTLDGKSPELYVTDLSHPKQGRQTPLAQVLGQEMRTRYLNPAWIKRMTAEGYAGDRFISNVVEYLWGWQVTAPEVVGGEKWQELVRDLRGGQIRNGPQGELPQVGQSLGCTRSSWPACWRRCERNTGVRTRRSSTRWRSNTRPTPSNTAWRAPRRPATTRRWRS